MFTVLWGLLLHVWGKGSIKPLVAKDKAECNLINCLQRHLVLLCIVGNVGARVRKRRRTHGIKMAMSAVRAVTTVIVLFFLYCP